MYAYEIKNIKKETVYKNREMRQHSPEESIPHALKSSVSNSRVTNV